MMSGDDVPILTTANTHLAALPEAKVPFWPLAADGLGLALTWQAPYVLRPISAGYILCDAQRGDGRKWE